MSDSNTYISIKEAADYLGLSYDTIYSLCHSRNRGFTAKQVGRCWRINKVSLDNWMTRP